MFLKFKVKIPEAPGKLVRKKRGGQTYIEYEYDRAYDPVKKYTYPKRASIGSENENLMTPNENFLKYFPDAVPPEELERENRSPYLNIGAYVVLRKLIKDGKILDILQEYMGNKDAGLLLDLACYSIIAENNAANAQNGANKPVLMKSKSGIVVKGIADLSVRFSKCCSPVPGDEIVGYVTRGRGISIHRTDCINIINLPEMERARLIDAEWEASPENRAGEKYLAEINIYANNRSGLLADISRALTEKNIDILSMNTRTNKQGMATLSASFEISSRDELIRIIDKIRTIDSVIDIERS